MKRDPRGSVRGEGRRVPGSCEDVGRAEGSWAESKQQFQSPRASLEASRDVALVGRGASREEQI